MNDEIKKVFINALSMTKNVEIDKKDIIRVGEEYGLVIPHRTSKADVVAKIVNEGYFNKLYDAFSEFLYIPIWEVGDYFKINTDSVLQLAELGVITDIPVEKEFYNRRNKDYYTANTYNIRILENYEKEDLKEKLRLANSGKGFGIRMFTDTKEEANMLIDELGKIFKLAHPSIHARRNEGYHTYANVKVLNNSELEKNTLLEEIKKLKKQLEEDRTEYYNIINKNRDIFIQRIKSRDKKIAELEKELENRDKSTKNTIDTLKKIVSIAVQSKENKDKKIAELEKELENIGNNF